MILFPTFSISFHPKTIFKKFHFDPLTKSSFLIQWKINEKFHFFLSNFLSLCASISISLTRKIFPSFTHILPLNKMWMDWEGHPSYSNSNEKNKKKKGTTERSKHWKHLHNKCSTHMQGSRSHSSLNVTSLHSIQFSMSIECKREH